MAQPSIASYFNSRKRGAYEDLKIDHAKKVLVLDTNVEAKGEVVNEENNKKCVSNVKRIITFHEASPQLTPSKIHASPQLTPGKLVKGKNAKSKINSSKNQKDIQQMLNNMKKNEEISKETVICEENVDEERKHVTPPRTPSATVKNALDKVKDKPEGPSLKEIRQKMCRSARLAELKASLSRFEDGANKLKEIEKKTKNIPESPRLKTFKVIELEVETSPQKVFSPEKSYLSPKKDISVRKNLVHLFSPTKNAVATTPESSSKQILAEISKPALTLPYKYRYLAEIFRCIDTVCQILYNRKETITFRKVKPGVEEMLKRNLFEKHLSQIKFVYPDAFEFSQEKLRVFGEGMKKEQWELVLKPKLINDTEQFTSDMLLNRRRKLFNILLNKVKTYHEEFLSNLDPPMTISKDKITRWHPEFDIEKVPDVETAELPQPPEVEKLITGKDVLEKAKQMFNCNTRMEQALQKLQEAREKNGISTPVKEEDTKPVPQSLLKGIPKALLEKVRQKQAAKALSTMTRSAEREKEVEKYSRLPEIARLTRNLFVSEKKSVLPLETVIEKLGNCYRANLSKGEMEEHLKLISKEVPKWLVFHLIRNCTYVKIAKNDDLSIILKHLENLAKQKNEM